jgi:hypothetical protein
MFPEKCRDAARIYLKGGYSVIPVTWDKAPHPYLLAGAQGRLKQLPWFHQGSYKLVYTGSFRLEPFYQAPQAHLFDKLFPAENIDVLWLSGSRGSFEVIRVKGYGVAICAIPGSYSILDFDLKGMPATLDTVGLAEEVAARLNTFTVASPHRGIHIYMRLSSLGNSEQRGWRIGDAELKLKGYCVAPPTKCFCGKCRPLNKGWSPINYMPVKQLPILDPKFVTSLVYSLLDKFSSQ